MRGLLKLAQLKATMASKFHLAMVMMCSFLCVVLEHVRPLLRLFVLSLYYCIIALFNVGYEFEWLQLTFSF